MDNTIFTKKRINLGELNKLKKLLKSYGLQTVCENALCPNIGECFHSGIATFLICGNICTRNCSFCAVQKGKPNPIDQEEPFKIVSAVLKMKIKHCVITSVTRDDLYDGGASQFVIVINELRKNIPDLSIEVLVPDFKGDTNAIKSIISVKPNIFSHNLETVPRLYNKIRIGADYKRSLDVLLLAKNSGLTIKSGLMLGMGESESEVLSVMDDLRNIRCDILTLGQYLSPSKNHYPIKRIIPQNYFEKLKNIALDKGFKYCFSAPYVRSSNAIL